MAFFKWLSTIDGDCVTSALQPLIADLGLVLDAELCHQAQLYALEPIQQGIHHQERVTVLATWSDRHCGEVQIEVRSGEPLLRPTTRCEQIASGLRQRMDCRAKPDLRRQPCSHGTIVDR